MQLSIVGYHIFCKINVHVAHNYSQAYELNLVIGLKNKCALPLAPIHYDNGTSVCVCGELHTFSRKKKTYYLWVRFFPCL